MNTNIQISLDEQLWAATVRVGRPLGLEPAQVVRQTLLGWLSQHDEARQLITQAERSAVVAEVCGKYVGVAPSTEAWMAQKREEAESEEQRFERRFNKDAEKPE